MVKLLNVKPYINIKAMISENIFAVCSIIGSVIFFFFGFMFSKFNKMEEDIFYKKLYDDFIKEQNEANE